VRGHLAAAPPIVAGTRLRWTGANAPKVVLPLLAALIAAGAVVAFPELSAVACVVVWGIAAAWALPVRASICVPLSLILLLPADHIVGLNGPMLGLFVFGAAMILFLSTLLRRPFLTQLRSDWDFLLLAGVLVSTTVLQSGRGEVRGVLFWVAACMMVYWFRSEERAAASPGRQIAFAFIIAGSISSVVAIVDYIGLIASRDLLPRYAPVQLDFVQFMGLRAVGMSGHPLRLGTLAMIASLIALAWLFDGRPTGRTRSALLISLGLSLSGLILSGARGSWLGFVLGYGVLGGLHWSRAALRRIGQMVLAIAALGVLLVATGLWPIIYERLFGSAFHPGSINQRLAALESVSIIWKEVPAFGVGFGGADELTQKAGLRLPNLENEYLRLFLTAGVAGPLALLTLGARRIRTSLRSDPGPRRTAALAVIVSLFVNITTYNLFAWSCAPTLLVAAALLSQPSTPREGGKSSGKHEGRLADA